MNYTKKQFGLDLLKQIDDSFDPIRLARWAYSKYLSKSRNLEEGLKEKIMQIVVMEEGPEFEMTQDELCSFALELTKNEANE